MRYSPVFALVAASVFALVTPPAALAESRVPCTALPSVVLDHAKAEAPDGTVRGCVKDRESGKLVYEVETTARGKSKDMTFDAAGTLIEVEQEIDRAALPPAVSSALLQSAADGQIGKVESVAKGGSITSYETVVTRRGRRHEVAFRPDGTAVKPD